ncbi:MAG: tRNA (adenosine(37)-N6)-threonylcarbamoyltransferase complex ATPase subunit type 1 TsaE [Desulfobacterales bacterium]|nr:tRNA (adenosine(37)-N6)-threonylcarbamoyltransferase complex ATPase subunit type 1 TsaE [Desulfobacterales bacterium]
MTTQSIRIHTASSDETRRLGTMVGRALAEPASIGLTGDLGCGKTVFVQGLARGLAVPDRYAVTSPTYTLINEYPGRLPFFHVDLYRITGADELTDIGMDDLAAGRGVIVIEWAERLPPELLSFDMAASIDMTGDFTRTFRFFFYRRPSGNLIRDLKNNFNADEE